MYDIRQKTESIIAKDKSPNLNPDPNPHWKLKANSVLIFGVSALCHFCLMLSSNKYDCNRNRCFKLLRFWLYFLNYLRATAQCLLFLVFFDRNWKLYIKIFHLLVLIETRNSQVKTERDIEDCVFCFEQIKLNILVIN